MEVDVLGHNHEPVIPLPVGLLEPPPNDSTIPNYVQTIPLRENGRLRELVADLAHYPDATINYIYHHMIHAEFDFKFPRLNLVIPLNRAPKPEITTMIVRRIRDLIPPIEQWKIAQQIADQMNAFVETQPLWIRERLRRNTISICPLGKPNQKGVKSQVPLNLVYGYTEEMGTTETGVLFYYTPRKETQRLDQTYLVSNAYRQQWNPTNEKKQKIHLDMAIQYMQNTQQSDTA